MIHTSYTYPRNEFLTPLTHEISNRHPLFCMCVCVCGKFGKKRGGGGGWPSGKHDWDDEREKISLEGEAKMVGTMLARGLGPKGRKTSAEVASTGSRGGEVSWSARQLWPRFAWNVLQLSRGVCRLVVSPSWFPSRVSCQPPPPPLPILINPPMTFNQGESPSQQVGRTSWIAIVSGIIWIRRV